MAFAWLRQTGSPGAKLVLMALADHANDDGVCWPSQATIARKAEMTPRSVRSNMAKLVGAGFVRVEERRRVDGSIASNLYVLDMTVSGPSVVSSAGPAEVSGADHRKPASGHEPSIEPSSSSSKKKKVLSLEDEGPDFLEWLGHHVTMAATLNISLSVPRHGTSYRAQLARTYLALRAEGYTAEELQLASDGVLSDTYMRENNYTKFDNVLRKEKIGRRVEDGRAYRQRRDSGQDPTSKYGVFDE